MMTTMKKIMCCVPPKASSHHQKTSLPELNCIENKRFSVWVRVERGLTNSFLFLCGKGSDAKCIRAMSKRKHHQPPLRLSQEAHAPSLQTLRRNSIQQAAKLKESPTKQCVSRTVPK